MMDEMMTEEARLDEAIDSYPLAALPPGFTQRVMKHVVYTPQLEARFQLHFIDLAVPAFMTVFGTAVLLTTLWLTGHWTLENVPQPILTTSFANYLEAIPEQWLLIGFIILLLELLVSLVIASQVISDVPQVAMQGSN